MQAEFDALVGEWGKLESKDVHMLNPKDHTLLATAFHPEVTGDDRVHRLFVDDIVR